MRSQGPGNLVEDVTEFISGPPDAVSCLRPYPLPRHVIKDVGDSGH